MSSVGAHAVFWFYHALADFVKQQLNQTNKKISGGITPDTVIAPDKGG